MRGANGENYLWPRERETDGFGTLTIHFYGRLPYLALGYMRVANQCGVRGDLLC